MMTQNSILFNQETNSGQLFIWLINANDDLSSLWINALRNSGIAVHAKNISTKNSELSIFAAIDCDLMIYHSPPDDDQIDSFFSTLHQSNNQVPVLIASETAETSLYIKYIADGACDIFAIDDMERLVAVSHREIKSFQLLQKLALTQEKLMETETRCQMLVESSEEAIAYIQDGMHMHINPSYQHIFGYLDEEELLVKPILDLIAETDQDDFKQFLRSANSLQSEQSIEINCAKANGQTFEALITFSPTIYEQENCTQVQVENIVLQHSVRKVIEQDPLTGLYNREHLLKDLNIYFHTKDPSSPTLYLFYLVVDGFEEMKNRHGLLESDHILQEISTLLQQEMKPNMTLYRFGDHSFTLLMPCEKISPTSESFAKSLLKTINQHQYLYLDNFIEPTLSIGISHANNLDLKQISADEASILLLNNAYLACHEIFSNAGNGIHIIESTPTLSDEVDEIDAIDDSIHLKNLIKHAIEHDRFKLLYQPIVSIQGNSRENYSVLLRLLDNDNQQIRPSHFIKQAIEFGQMKFIDRWVIKTAIDELVAQRRQGSRINFHIQLSQSAITDETLLLWIVDCIRDSNAKGAWITFQFKCSDIFDYPVETEKLMLGLKKINCKIAITQFTLNEQAIHLIEWLPIDTIKLAHHLIKDLPLNIKNKNQLIKLNKTLQAKNIKTIASKIEEAETLALLWSIGINYIQGFFLQEPSSKINYDFH